ncbi:MAG: hypothetical protein CMF51_01825 [Legionellales bacterium]|nr:hypothetical protein [Legionellales bacterium]
MRYWVLGLGLLLSSCAHQLPKVDQFNQQSEDHLYQKASYDFKAKRYHEAAENFEALSTHYPISKHTKQAILNSIYARFMLREAAMVDLLAEQYIHRYVRDQGAAYAQYMRALSPLLKHSSALQRMVDYHPNNHGVDLIVDSFARLKQSIELYPHSPYVKPALSLMRYLRQLIAQNELDVARYYFKQGAYEAALNRAMKVIAIDFNQSNAKPTLQLMIHSYERLGLKQQARRIKTISDSIKSI